MTLAQRYIQQGVQNERMALAQKLLAKGFKHALIKEITGIDANALKKMEQAAVAA